MGGRQQKVLRFSTLVSCVFALLSPAEGQIRLAGYGTTRCSGRVEVYHSGSWGTVCDDSWGLSDAEVVCRQLGCGAAVNASQAAYFGQGTGPIWLDNVVCSGSESDLTQCGHRGFGRHDCGHHEDAGVICSGAHIRLAGPGSTRCSGRVEIYHGGSWGTVCDDGWDLSDAKVVCKELSCGTALNATAAALFGQGTGPIWLDDVACSGTEAFLTHCGHRGFGTHNCGHSKDAGVVCSVSLPKPNIAINPREVEWGQGVHITCSISPEFLGGTFVLRKASGSFTQTKTTSSTTSSPSATFSLQKVDLDHDGSFQCQYEKYISSKQFVSSLSDSAGLSVTVSFPKPSISMSPAGELTWGQSVRFTCSISTQILGGTFILLKRSSSFRRTEASGSNSAVFWISGADFNDEGEYQCQYQKKGPSREFTSPESDSVQLSVTVRLQTPSISLTSPSGGLVRGPEGAEVTKGYSFDFTCSINTRFSSGRFILTSSGSNLTKAAVNNSGSFHFPAAAYEHQGNYSCLYQVTVSTRTFTSSPAAPISVVIKLRVMLLVSSVSAGILLLLLLLLLVVCLMRRRRRLAKKAKPLIQTQMAVRVENDYIHSDDDDDDDDDEEEDYVNVDVGDTNKNIKGGAAGVDEEESDDYVQPASDDDLDYEEVGPNDDSKQPTKARLSFDNRREDSEKETSDDDDDDDDHDYEEAGPNPSYMKEAYVGVSSHREDEADDEEETSDEENNYENVSAPSPSGDNAEEEEASDEENDYENVSPP